MYIVNYRRRVKVVFFCFFVFLLASCIRLIFIQVFRSDYLARLAQKQHNLFIELEPRRGNIYDSNLKPQAVNLSVDSIYASPNEMKEKEKTVLVQKVAPLLDMSAQQMREKVSRKKSFVWLARKVPADRVEAIKKLNPKGIGFIKESKRCYPNAYLASHIIGFAGLDNAGLEGLELYYDKYLRGTPGWAVLLRDARQKKLDLSEKMVAPVDGFDVVLTIDEVIQYIAERELEKVYETYHASGASVIVMDPYTGQILALANRPTYDLNEYGKSGKDARRNRALTDMFEPGSVYKIVTLAAALEKRRVSEEDRFFCENGAYRVGNHTLHDHTKHGWLTFREVIEQSSNIGTTKVAQMLGENVIYEYSHLFGFGSVLGIDLPGEIGGMLKKPQFWSKTSISAVPIGQEVGVDLLQLAAAISVPANGGQLMQPYIVKEIRDKKGECIKEFAPVVIRQVVSSDTAARMRKILAGVIENGTGKLAQLDGYSAAGKTGTAQKVEANGRYSHSKYFASFIGFAPAEDPVIAIAVTLDEPHPYYFGGVVAAPVFKNVANEVLRYLKTNNKVIAFNETFRDN